MQHDVTVTVVSQDARAKAAVEYDEYQLKMVYGASILSHLGKLVGREVDPSQPLSLDELRILHDGLVQRVEGDSR